MLSDLATKLATLQEKLQEWESILIAYSGGVDSSLLLKVASMTPVKVLAVTAASPTYPQVEIDAATNLAKELGVQHMVMNSKEMDNPEFCANPPERCYHCKKELFADLQKLAREHGLKVIVDGANVDDCDDFRPGRKAAQEYGVKSPLQEAGLTKADIRQLARHLGLPNWDKPSMACLSSRIPYGQAITPAKLAQVNAAEAYLRQLGLQELRVRHHGSIARIEVNAAAFALLIDNQVRQALVNHFHEIGFTYIALDLEGFRSGSMNAVLPVEEHGACVPPALQQ
ncbi:ATP-dependent sacrificial sulfur transferase LarE [Moorella naiadis]|uniref:ATP-dependent sacrificial sulfur transferase LarE n=1 Tax=Moorella naiadis (nom. illeg.) TaxID=3093670 RepID=UPI003D9C8AF2